MFLLPLLVNGIPLSASAPLRENHLSALQNRRIPSSRRFVTDCSPLPTPSTQ